MTGFINFDNDFSEAYRFEYFEISPFYRLYFKSKNANNSGFSVQSFLSLTSGEYDYYPDDYTYDSSNNSGVKDIFGLAGGAVLDENGSIKKYSFEIHVGVDRYFAFEKTNNTYREGTAFPRINLPLAKGSSYSLTSV